ncbi:MAG: hypothetical protein L6Q95_07700 [Planctomycetes bacterium]|nr:hypothetical protein [Planctomycetota bacterium]
MRLPKALRGPPDLPRTWWIAGAGVMVILLFVMLAMPWHEIGQRVRDSELPRPRFHGPRWGLEKCIATGDYTTIVVDRNAEPAMPDPEAWFREHKERRPYIRTFLLRAHRHVPWNAVARILDGAARAGQPDILLQIGVWNFLDLRLEPGDAEVTITKLPLQDPEGTLARIREHAGGGPLVRVDLEAGEDVETVLHALECFAAGEDEGAVRLALPR